MKRKLIFILLMILFLTGCGQEKSSFDDAEIEYIKDNNELKCIKENKDEKYRLWSFQNPKTYEIVRQTLTIDKGMEYYPKDDKRADELTYAWQCGDYDTEKFSDCETERYMKDFRKSSARVRTKYTYYSLEPKEEDKDLLKEVQGILEKDGYTCELNMK